MKLLHVETEGAGNSEAREVAELFPAFIEHSSFNKIHKVEVVLWPVNAGKRDGGILSYQLHCSNFRQSEGALENQGTSYAMNRHS